MTFYPILYKIIPVSRFYTMRGWRNWQTRTFEGRVGNRTGSSPVLRTIIPKEADYRVAGFFFFIQHYSKREQQI